MCLYVGVCLCMKLSMENRGIRFLEDEFYILVSHGSVCWELNFGLLQEQYLLLTTEPFVRTQYIVFKGLTT